MNATLLAHFLNSGRTTRFQAHTSIGNSAYEKPNIDLDPADASSYEKETSRDKKRPRCPRGRL